MTASLERYFGRLERRQPWRWRGKVLESVGQTIESSGPLASVGECCEIEDRLGNVHRAEVIGFRGSNVVSMPVETTEGIRFGDSVSALGITPEMEVGKASGLWEAAQFGANSATISAETRAAFSSRTKWPASSQTSLASGRSFR